ncbi:Mn-dependent transcriptional regulator MntR [Olavius sp. associated proteobacterium Delta 1]|nr:Mn-dependent transcriptional regulator MntR [Olavius sp. associated proteobacterium Delta 1]
MQSEAAEKYLKTIYEIQQHGGRVKTTTLAQTLGVTAGSVTDMIKRLSNVRPKLVSHELHKGVALTPRGKKVALSVIRRHRLLETFLNRVLGFSWDEVHDEAQNLEHHISDRLTDAIAEYLNHPQYDPHGDPIPEKDGKVKTDNYRSLASTPLGESVRIARVHHNDAELLRYLDELEIRLETIVTVVEKAPFKGPLSIRVGAQRKAPVKTLGIDVADDIMVESISESLFE